MKKKYYVVSDVWGTAEAFDTEQEVIDHITDNAEEFGDLEEVPIFYGEQKKFVPPSSKGSLVNCDD